MWGSPFYLVLSSGTGGLLSDCPSASWDREAFCREMDTDGSVKTLISLALPVVDLRGTPGMRAPPQPKFLHFHAVFRKKWPNSKLAPPFGLAHPLWEILDSATNNERGRYKFHATLNNNRLRANSVRKPASFNRKTITLSRNGKWLNIYRYWCALGHNGN